MENDHSFWNIPCISFQNTGCKIDVYIEEADYKTSDEPAEYTHRDQDDDGLLGGSAKKSYSVY